MGPALEEGRKALEVVRALDQPLERGRRADAAIGVVVADDVAARAMLDRQFAARGDVAGGPWGGSRCQQAEQQDGEQEDAAAIFHGPSLAP